jgi:peptide/nickel transport system ATP-binding protein
MLLNVSNLQLSFGNNIVLDNISFSLNEKETIGIVGESGSGKSLTALSIIGLLPNSATVNNGTIEYFENNKPIDLLSITEKEKQQIRGNKISMIFQEPMTSLNPVMKCGKQVAEVLEYHKNYSFNEARDFTLDLFNEVMLPSPAEVFNKYPHQLSGGQRQRVMIAMALACNPKILLADEPTTALDVTVQKNILDLIAALQEKHGLSIIFISHDLGVISRVANKILVLHKGKQVEYGSAQQIISNPQQPYTKGLIACRPGIGARPKQLPVVADFLSNNSSPQYAFITKQERNESHQHIYSQPPVLEIENLNAYFNLKHNLWGKPVKTFNVLKNIDLKVWQGETVGLVGESGSGKSTLGRTLLQLIENVSGNITYNSKSVMSFNRKELKAFRQKFQLIFQDPYSSLNPNHTIGYSIMEPMVVHNIYKTSTERRNKVLELLEKTGLESSWFDRYPHQLSGGQRQRVVIARALATNPEFLICDESVSALDVSVQAQILNLLNQLKQQFKLTYIFISHDLAVIKYMSDRILVMKQGEIVEYGEADELCNAPKEEYTKTLLESII